MYPFSFFNRITYIQEKFTSLLDIRENPFAIRVIEIDADTSIGNVVKILSEFNILSAPVRDSAVQDCNDWRERYLGILDYSAIVLWVLESAEIEAKVLSANSTAVAGTGVCAAGALGALAMTATAGPAVAAGLTVAAVGAAMAGGVAAKRGIGNDAPTAADKLGKDFYKVILQEEPFKSTMLLLSKYRMRSVPVIETGKPFLKNLIAQSAVIRGLEECKERDWFDSIWAHPISDLGLPYMSSNEVISIRSDELILEAFKKMRDNNIGGLPVVQGPKKQIGGKVSTGDIRFLLLKPELFSNFRSGHRIYVTTGEDNEVVGVIMLRDVISCFIFEPPIFF
ncbi:hypothetical protein RND71_023745 [Anisodus tanguticus]|uniref:CBS domain-containing protein n=1 Tax=Anisodus tanguticus TaxID=243964 RepID=A0AAE1VF22_9SOLA|nr:hypothetical protein RND71_023745 [Anisodus tanguticus]